MDISMKGFVDIGDEVLHGDGGRSTNGHIWYVRYGTDIRVCTAVLYYITCIYITISAANILQS